MVSGATIWMRTAGRTPYAVRGVKGPRGVQARCQLCVSEGRVIVPDSEAREPIVPNGITTRGLHHGAFDHLLIGVRPDYCIEAKTDDLPIRRAVAPPCPLGGARPGDHRAKAADHPA
jgi:hypothetical protein